MTEEQVRDIFEQVKNWGRWGPQDRLGTLNYITPACRTRAGSLVTEGVSVSCALEINTQSSILNPAPAQHFMIRAADLAPGAGYAPITDFLGMAPHGPGHTHIDALCHVVFDGRSFNGVPAREMTSMGVRANDITATEHGVVTRGVLLDIPAMRGVAFVEPEDAIHIRDLEAAEAMAGLRVAGGDTLLIRTGRHQRVKAKGASAERHEGKLFLAGLHPETLAWFHERQIALLVADGGHDVLPSPYPTRLPIHIGALVFMGLHLIDNAQLDDLAAACLERKRWDFLFTLAPLRLRGGTGCAVNPIATF